MAHFAKLGLNNEVLEVLSVYDTDCYDANDVENEEIGRQFLENLTGWPTWKKCSFNTKAGKYYWTNPETEKYEVAPLEQQSKAFRLNYPGTGYKYDEWLDGFVNPQPYRNWTLNESTGEWDPPVARPSDDITKEGGTVVYTWDSVNNTWVNQGSPGTQP